METMITQPPAETLDTMAELREALSAQGDALCTVERPVKSLWLRDLIGKIRAEGGFPSNNRLYELAEQHLGLEPTHYYGSNKRDVLGWLVYFNEAYQRVDELTADGYQPLTQALVDQAFTQNRSIEIYLGEPFITVSGVPPVVKKVYRVRRIGGVNYVVPPKTRNQCVRIMGQPAKLV